MVLNENFEFVLFVIDQDIKVEDAGGRSISTCREGKTYELGSCLSLSIPRITAAMPRGILESLKDGSPRTDSIDLKLIMQRL